MRVRGFTSCSRLFKNSTSVWTKYQKGNYTKAQHPPGGPWTPNWCECCRLKCFYIQEFKKTVKRIITLGRKSTTFSFNLKMWPVISSHWPRFVPAPFWLDDSRRKLLHVGAAGAEVDRVVRRTVATVPPHTLDGLHAAEVTLCTNTTTWERWVTRSVSSRWAGVGSLCGPTTTSSLAPRSQSSPTRAACHFKYIHFDNAMQHVRLPRGKQNTQDGHNTTAPISSLRGGRGGCCRWSHWQRRLPSRCHSNSCIRLLSLFITSSKVLITWLSFKKKTTIRIVAIQFWLYCNRFSLLVC